MEFIIYLIIGIIYAIASANGYNGRYSRNNFRLRDREYGRYGLIGLDDDVSFDTRYDRIREEFSRRLEIYYRQNQPRLYLKNNHCELKLVKNEKGVYFYCKERTNGKRKGSFFEVSGNDLHASTMWGIIDMEFNKRTDYNSLKSLYNRLNATGAGNVRYFYEPVFKKYPDYDEYNAQNEYCKMEYIQNDNCVICSEIWNNTPKQFIIRGNKYLLLNIISAFKSEKDKFQTYSELLAKYSVRKDVTINVLQRQDAEDEQKKKEPNIVPKEENLNNIQNQSVEQGIDNIKENNTDFGNIEKFNERKLDL